MYTLIERDGKFFVANAESKEPVSDGFDNIEDAALKLGAMMRESLEAKPAAEEKALPDTTEASKSVCAAIDLADNKTLIALQDELKKLMSGEEVNWNTPDSFHVTLVYVPNVDDTQADALWKAVGSVPEPELTLKTAELDWFGANYDADGGYALHYRLQPDPALQEYQSKLYSAMADVGLPLSDYSVPDQWKPHITMGYAKEEPRVKAVGSKSIDPNGVLVWHGDSNVVYYSAKEINAAPKVDSEQEEYTGGVLSRVTRWFKSLGMDAKNIEAPVGNQFYALGNRAWMAIYSNNFEDRDGEIISDAALEDNVKRIRADKTLLPELWAFHKPGTKHGKAVVVGKEGHFVYAIGQFDDTPLGRAMEKHYLAAQRKSKGRPVFGLSHGFTYPEWALEGGVYKALTTFEVSTLPHSYAANPYTGFITLDQLESKAMPLTEQDYKDLELVVPPDAIEYVKEQEGRMAKSGKALEGLAKFKKFTAPNGVATIKGNAPKPSADDDDEEDLDLDDGDDEGIKAVNVKANAHLAQLVGDVLSAQADLNNLVQGIGAAIGAQNARMAQIEEALALDADAASESDETIVDELEDGEDEETAEEYTKASQALAQRKNDNNNLSRMAPGLFTRS